MLRNFHYQWLESNFWKIWIYVFTNRRAYIPLLGIYFLTFPDNTIKQIWFYTAVWALTSFIFEIPSGYFSDRFGHKKTLILAKIFMLLSTLCFIVGNSVVYFAIGSVFLSLWFAFTSGTISAFVHENLVELNKWNLFTKIWGRIWGSVSLFNALLIIAIPFLTKISFQLPFLVGLWFDMIGLIIAFMITNTKKDEEIKKPKNIVNIIKETKSTNFWPIATFSILIAGIMYSTHSFRYPYLEHIGYPVIYIGFVMWLSRIVWFGVSRIVHKIEARITIKKLLFLEIFLFTLFMVLVALIKNAYIVWLIFSVFVWYYWWRGPIIKNYIINTLPDKKYKATMLSVKEQISSLLSFVLIFVLWYIMNYSYTVGFLFVGWLFLVSLSISYIFVRKIK